MEDLELKKVEQADEIPVVVHGTYFRLWDSICEISSFVLVLLLL